MIANTQSNIQSALTFQQWFIRQALFKTLASQDVISTNANVHQPIPKHKNINHSYLLNKDEKLSNKVAIHRPRCNSDDILKASTNSAFDYFIRSKESSTQDIISPTTKVLPIVVNRKDFVGEPLKKINISINIHKIRDLSSIDSTDSKTTKNTTKCNIDITGENDCDNSKSETSSQGNIKKFSIRLDVVNKTILRCFKKFFITEFKSYYDFNKSKKGEVTSEELLLVANEYLSKNLGELNFGNMNVFLAALVDTKHKVKNTNTLYEKLKDEMSGLLYNFNRKRLDNLMSYPEFSRLLLYFLNQPSVIHQIAKNKNDPSIMKAYQKQVKRLSEQCREYLVKTDL